MPETDDLDDAIKQFLDYIENVDTLSVSQTKPEPLINEYKKKIEEYNRVKHYKRAATHTVSL